jgi:hypothetical protein
MACMQEESCECPHVPVEMPDTIANKLLDKYASNNRAPEREWFIRKRQEGY